MKILIENKAIFARNKNDLGCTHLMEHEIDLVEGAEAHREGLRRLSPEKLRQANDQLDALVEMGVVVPAKGPWASAIVMAKKKGDQLRMCIDFRKLNEVTIKDAFPLPRIDDAITKLGSAKYFTTGDLGSAFWQVPLRKKDQHLTGFAHPKGLYMWTRMPFGLCNATGTFQRLMSRIFGHLSEKYGNVVLCYVDDLMIATNTIEEHLVRLKEVFEAIRGSGLKLNPDKCSLFQRQSEISREDN